MLNVLGTPDYASFATYAYAAGPHFDKDDSPTSGWVISRSEKVLNLNFMCAFS
jgi:hypothetical protein